MLKFSITPKQTKFYDLFERSTANLVIAAGKLLDLFEDYQEIENKVKKLKDLEHEGDVITHQIIQSMHRTFVTPIDKEDIQHLANSLDDVMDFTEAAARTCILYRITEPTQRAKELASVILMIAHKLNEIMPLLRRRDKFGQVLEQCVEINRLENEADDINHAAQAELFEDSEDPINIIKWREIYDLLESATDRGEDVANVLEAVVLKHA